tara:strand:- start:412 stop:906 length:495 start_codon:yes stop_codon:yes gene_type:complete
MKYHLMLLSLLLLTLSSSLYAQFLSSESFDTTFIDENETDALNPNISVLENDNDSGNSETVEEGHISSQILVYPSPCLNGNCELGFKVSIGSIQGLKLKIYDMKGFEIIDHSFDVLVGYHKENLKPLFPLNISTGVYHIILTDKENEIQGKTKLSIVNKGEDQS